MGHEFMKYCMCVVNKGVKCLTHPNYLTSVERLILLILLYTMKLTGYEYFFLSLKSYSLSFTLSRPKIPKKKTSL